MKYKACSGIALGKGVQADKNSPHGRSALHPTDAPGDVSSLQTTHHSRAKPFEHLRPAEFPSCPENGFHLNPRRRKIIQVYTVLYVVKIE
jgi:hypothetical protein